MPVQRVRAIFESRPTRTTYLPELILNASPPDALASWAAAWLVVRHIVPNLQLSQRNIEQAGAEPIVVGDRAAPGFTPVLPGAVAERVAFVVKLASD